MTVPMTYAWPWGKEGSAVPNLPVTASIDPKGNKVKSQFVGTMEEKCLCLVVEILERRVRAGVVHIM